MKQCLTGLIASACIAAAGSAAFAGATPLSTKRVATGLTRPIFVTHAPNDFSKVYIIEKAGVIKTMNLSSGAIATWLDINSIVGGGTSSSSEQGLLGLAFHPDFANNGFFYVDYTNNSGNTVIERRTVDLNTGAVLPGTESTVITYAQPEANHNGGWIAFGPDGYLYVSAGDGGGGCDQHGSTGNGQNMNVLLGKLLRLDVNSDDFPVNIAANYGIPPTNPFVGVPNTRGEIWDYGLRNPWRPSFDRETGDLWIADVGQGQREEVNFEPAGSAGGINYGWRCREGFIASTSSGCSTTGCAGGSFTDPILDYTHGAGRCSITGGYVYRGCAMPDMHGTYFYADYCSSTIWSTTYNGTLGTIVDRTAELTPPAGQGFIASITSFGEDAYGEIYICDQDGGEIFKIVPAAGVMTDCNNNNIEDACEILAGMTADINMNGIPDECETLCMGDINASGQVDVDDLNAVLGVWNTNVGIGDPRDLANNDGFIDVDDLNVILSNWLGCP